MVTPVSTVYDDLNDRRHHGHFTWSHGQHIPPGILSPMALHPPDKDPALFDQREGMFLPTRDCHDCETAHGSHLTGLGPILGVRQAQATI